MRLQNELRGAYDDWNPESLAEFTVLMLSERFAQVQDPENQIDLRLTQRDR